MCGRPRQDALELLAGSEPFDRGFYAGPFGWIGQEAAEFVVAIRSALVQPQGAARAALPPGTAETAAAQGQQQQQQQQLAERRASHAAAGPGPASAGAGSPSAAPEAAAAAPLAADGTLVSLFAGVGIVRGSETASEWAELDLKVRRRTPPLLRRRPLPPLLPPLLVPSCCAVVMLSFQHVVGRRLPSTVVPPVALPSPTHACPAAGTAVRAAASEPHAAGGGAQRQLAVGQADGRGVVPPGLQHLLHRPW